MKCVKRHCIYNKNEFCNNELIKQLTILGAKLLNCTEYKIIGTKQKKPSP